MKNGFLLVALFIVMFDINAYEVSPIYQIMDSVGSRAQSSYTLKNVEPEDILIEVYAYRVEFKGDEEVLVPADDEFLILPPQAKIKGKGYQNFRIRYLPGAHLDQTTPYRVIFKQIKLKQEVSDSSEVEMLINFSTLAFVSPPKSSASPIAHLAEGSLFIKNTGNKVLDMSAIAFKFVTPSGNESLEWGAISGNSGLYLLPGYEKMLPLSGSVASATDVTLTYKP